MSGKEILEEMKQEDYELWIRTQGYSHLSEEQWDWLINNFEKRRKEISTSNELRNLPNNT